MRCFIVVGTDLQVCPEAWGLEHERDASTGFGVSSAERLRMTRAKCSA